MEATRLRLAWMARDGRVALSAINPDNFYEHVSLPGRIVEIHEDTDLADIDRLSPRYNGAPHAVRDARGSARGWRPTPTTASTRPPSRSSGRAPTRAPGSGPPEGGPETPKVRSGSGPSGSGP